MVAALAAPALADPAHDAVLNSMLAFEKLTSYHVTVESHGHVVQADYVAHGKWHMTAGGMELIIVDNAMYVKMQGNWMKVPGAAAGAMTGGITGAVERARKTATDKENFTATDLGMKTVGGTTYHAYDVRSKSSSKPSTFFVTKDGYLGRIETLGEGQTTAVTFSNYNQPAKIEAPI
jgi:flavin-binding protein dodecin